jgi:putative endopeptidase
LRRTAFIVTSFIESQRMIVNASRATLLAAVRSSCLVTRPRAQAPDDATLSRLEQRGDASIKPGDDFYSYANGAWLKGAEIPAREGNAGEFAMRSTR